MIVASLKLNVSSSASVLPMKYIFDSSLPSGKTNKTKTGHLFSMSHEVAVVCSSFLSLAHSHLLSMSIGSTLVGVQSFNIFTLENMTTCSIGPCPPRQEMANASEKNGRFFASSDRMYLSAKVANCSLVSFF